MNYSGRYLSIGAAALGLVLSGPYSETAPLKAAPRPDRFYRESVLKQAVNKTESDILELAAAFDRSNDSGGSPRAPVSNMHDQGTSKSGGIEDPDPGAGLTVCTALVNCPGPLAGPSPEKELFFEGRNFKLLTHVVGSHAQVAMRPVTALKRLFYLVYDTIKDSIGFIGRVGSGRKDRIPELSGETSMDLGAWEERLDQITGRPSSMGYLDFFIDGKEFFPRFFDAIEGAEKSVHIRTYIFDNDDFAVRVADTLKERSDEIDIKVLMDGLGTIVATGVTPDTMPDGFKQPGSVREYLTNNSGVRVRQQSNPWFTGDHTKTITVDGKRAFIGGMNVGREYRYEVHDLMVEVNGPAAGRLEHDFGKAWASGGFLGDLEGFFHLFKRTPKTGGGGEDYPVRLLYTKPGDSEIRKAQLEAIRRSRAYIYIQNPYFTDDAILHELINARHRGVDVRVVLPVKVDNGTVARSNALAANKMLKNGIRVYILPRASHVKAAVYDGWACFGSANFDKLSLRVNYEIDLATSHPDAVQGLVERLFNSDFEESEELTEEFAIRTHDFLLELLADQL